MSDPGFCNFIMSAKDKDCGAVCFGGWCRTGSDDKSGGFSGWMSGTLAGDLLVARTGEGCRSGVWFWLFAMSLSVKLGLAMSGDLSNF